MKKHVLYDQTSSMTLYVVTMQIEESVHVQTNGTRIIYSQTGGKGLVHDEILGKQEVVDIWFIFEPHGKLRFTKYLPGEQ